MAATTIGFAGAGIMGAPMMGHLVQAGYSVRALRHSARSEERIVAAGAQPVFNGAELADAAVLITMLPAGPDVESLLFDDGLAERLGTGQTFIDMSTIAPETAVHIADRLDARGVASLDAPVSGGEAGAIEGTLSIMVGGEAQTLAAVEPVFEALGSTVTHVGGHGAGQTVKAANQLVVAANLSALAEAIVLLERSGVDLGAGLTALQGGLAGSTVLARKREAFLSGEFVPGARVSLHRKDLQIVAATARRLGITLPIAEVVGDELVELERSGGADLDHSALLLQLRAMNDRGMSTRS